MRLRFKTKKNRCHCQIQTKSRGRPAPDRCEDCATQHYIVPHCLQDPRRPVGDSELVDRSFVAVRTPTGKWYVCIYMMAVSLARVDIGLKVNSSGYDASENSNKRENKVVELT